MRMSVQETSVTRGRNGARGPVNPASQRSWTQLDLKQEEDRYETAAGASQAEFRNSARAWVGTGWGIGAASQILNEADEGGSEPLQEARTEGGTQGRPGTS